MPRRRSIRSGLEIPFRAFAEAAGGVEAAKRAALLAIPSSRGPVVALADALLGFREGLDVADSAMPGWRVAETEEVWDRCAAALEAARRAEEALRLGGGAFSHEALLATLGDLIATLDPFEEAARRFKELRAGRRY